MVQHSAQEQVPMGKTCKQVAAGKPSLSMLHLSCWGWDARDKVQEMFMVMWSLHLFLNLFCKGHDIFKQSLCLLYLQRLRLHLALVQLCSVDKSCMYLTAVLEYSFREKKCWRQILSFTYFAFLFSFVTGETLKSMWRCCAFTSINAKELCVCISSDWNIDTEKVIHDITQ